MLHCPPPLRAHVKQTQTQNMEDQHLKDPSGQYLGVRVVQQTLHVDRTRCYVGLAWHATFHNATLLFARDLRLSQRSYWQCSSNVMLLNAESTFRQFQTFRRIVGPSSSGCVHIHTYIAVQSTIFIVKSNIICFRTTQKLKTKRRVLWSREKLRFSTNRKKKSSVICYR
jgi:hypothetical protein